MFNEINSIENVFIQTILKNGRKYIDREHLGRDQSDVLDDSLFKNALIKFNPEIQEGTERADEVIHKLRTMILSCNHTTW